ncbi:retropepsin-like aspartic protease family protein [Reyranella sp.]|uniref:retropepsin-like aspartic protease family protein n=1 Tax=Reyranella sp. TaxID=1929291 RepID=UPI003BAA1886
MLLFGARAPQAQEAAQFIAQWQSSNAVCRAPATPALEAIAACEQRDTYSKLLSASNYCYGPIEGAPAGWTPCGGDPAAGKPSEKALKDAALARATQQFQRMGGVFVLPATINGTSTAYFIVDSGASNVQISEELADELKRNGSLTEADSLGQRRFILADGSGRQQRIVRLRSIKIGERTMENVMASVSPGRGHGLLGQSFLRRLSSWKIDNVKNSIEFEFTGAF